jgi:protease stability complex PrcB-like protein
VLAAALVAVGIVVYLLPEAKSHPVAWRDLSGDVGPLPITHSERRLFRESEQLARYLRSVGAKSGPPKVDFSSRQLLLLSPGPRSSSGYAVDVLSVTEKDGKITVKVRERTPTLSDHVQPSVTYPYALLSLPAGADVYVDWIGR